MNLEKLLHLYNAPYNYIKRNAIRKYNLKRVNTFISGKQPLNKTQRKTAKEFYSNYCKISTKFHEFYYEKTGIFCKEYLPTDIYANYIDAFYNDRFGAKKLDNKCYYNKLFPNISQADNIAYRTNGIWTNKNYQLLDETSLLELIASEPSLFIKKATNSFGGKGVQYVDAQNEDVSSALNVFCAGTPEDIVIQRPIKQHAALAAINESSVNTIRVISLLSANSVKCYSTVLRMGVDGSKVDNASSGGITCGITAEGKLRKTAYKPSGEKFETHPTSGVIFEDYTIPSIQEVWNVVKKAHPMVPHFRLVSWDFAIDEAGQPVMIEANLCLGELDFHQLNNGPLFGDDTKKILDEVFGKK